MNEDTKELNHFAPSLVSLPKWPQMLVSGAPVKLDQASEIIRRTDSFFTGGFGGNDRLWNERLAKRVRMPFDAGAYKPDGFDFQAKWRAEEAWRKAWGTIETEYVKNNWLSSCFIGGPHGWCAPNGSISYSDNIGKWPSVKDVLSDWSILAWEFPYLDLAATLMSGESCESDLTPVATILVCGGTATVAEGDLKLHERFGSIPFRDGNKIDRYLEALSRLKTSHEHEHGPIPEAWFQAWERRAASLNIPRY